MNNTLTNSYAIINHSPEVLCVLDEEMQFINVSKGAEALYGFAKEQLIGKYFIDFAHPENYGLLVSTFDSIKAGRDVSWFEYRCMNKDGAAITMSWSASWVPEEQVMFCVAQTGSKKVEEPLPAEQDDNYKLLFYSNPLPIMIYDRETLLIYDVNQMAAQLYGYNHEEFLALTIKEISPAEDIPSIIESVKGAVFNREVQNLGTWTHIKKDGDLIKVEVTGHSIKYMGRHCMIAVCNDITEQSRALRSLELSIERFEYVTEATSDIVWDWNLETNEVTYSINIKKSFGHTPGVNIGDMRFFAQHVHPDDRERVVLYPNPVKYGTMKYWGENYRFRKADGEYAFVQDKGIVIRDENGVGIRMIGAMQDITDLKNKELQIADQNEQLQEHAANLNNLNVLKDRLIGIMAHDLRGPLGSLKDLFELFQDESISHQQLLQMIPGVVKKLDYTSDFLDTLLFWINSHMENSEKALKDFSIAEQITKEAENLNDQAAKKCINLNFSVPDDLIAMADPDSLRIVVRNLVTNAIKFSKPQDIIEITAERDEDNILIRVKDSGMGMTPEQLKKLFKTKVNSKTGTNNESGTGMGLLFCKDLLEKCKGKIWAESELGVGTELSFTVPAAH